MLTVADKSKNLYPALFGGEGCATADATCRAAEQQRPRSLSEDRAYRAGGAPAICRVLV